MTVEELIEKLQEMPQGATVYVNDAEDDMVDPIVRLFNLSDPAFVLVDCK